MEEEDSPNFPLEDEDASNHPLEEEDSLNRSPEVEWRYPKILTFPAHAPIQGDSTTFSSREPSFPSMDTDEMDLVTDTPTTINLPMDDDRGKSPSCTTPASGPPSSNSSEESPTLNYQQRFLRLQAFLKLCDEADQTDLLEALRSLSAAARSGHAINLESRALMLSIEEGRELVRLKMLNVMGKGKDTPSKDAGTTPVGVRLPAPGTVTDMSGES